MGRGVWNQSWNAKCTTPFYVVHPCSSSVYNSTGNRGGRLPDLIASRELCRAQNCYDMLSLLFTSNAHFMLMCTVFQSTVLDSTPLYRRVPFLQPLLCSRSVSCRCRGGFENIVPNFADIFMVSCSACPMSNPLTRRGGSSVQSASLSLENILRDLDDLPLPIKGIRIDEGK